jgi:O-antigen/teichoic acid export membrane protein
MAVGPATSSDSDPLSAVSPRRFFAQAALTAASNLAIAGLTLLTGVLAARLLGPEGRGELAAIQTWPTTLGALAMLGLPEALVYHSARAPGRAGRYLGAGVTLGLALSLPAMAVGYALAPLLLSSEAVHVADDARRYLLIVPLFALLGMQFQPLRGLRHLVAWNLLRLAPAVGVVLVFVTARTTGHVEAPWIAGGYLVVYAVAVVPAAATVARLVPGPFRPGPGMGLALLRYGLPSALGAIPQLLSTRLALLVLAALTSPATLGVYAVAAAWGSALQPLMSGVSDVLMPTIAAGGTRSSQVGALERGVRLVVASCVLLVPAFVLATPWIFPGLFGRDFGGGVPAAMVLVIAGALTGLNTVLEDGMRGLGRPATAMWAELLGLAVLVTLLLGLVRPLGVMGAALATLTASATVMLLLIARTGRLTGSRPIDLLRPTAAELAAVRDHLVRTARRAAVWRA